ncbi:unnamed protein product [Pieris macdunnoughi]|uniref:Uncharacterized protein n=1 Tax=Pieris macdunnoughi TaxID=345717 RepID=A0A821QWF8_9NEOP|nr:unnamed protein product [Pieris macdunnoughi]
MELSAHCDRVPPQLCPSSGEDQSTMYWDVPLISGHTVRVTVSLPRQLTNTGWSSDIGCHSSCSVCRGEQQNWRAGRMLFHMRPCPRHLRSPLRRPASPLKAMRTQRT